MSQVFSGLPPQSSLYGYGTWYLILVFVGRVRRREDGESSRTRALGVLGKASGYRDDHAVDGASSLLYAVWFGQCRGYGEGTAGGTLSL